MKKHTLVLRGGKKIYYSSVGSGKVLILFHGFGIDSVIWKKTLPFLKKHFRVILVDLPGYGKNPLVENNVEGSYNEFFQGLLSVERNSVVLGYSFGGVMFLRYLLSQQKPSIDGAVFLSTPLYDSLVSLSFSFLLRVFSFSQNTSRLLLFLLTRAPLRTIIIKKMGIVSPKDTSLINFCVENIRSHKNPQFLCASLLYIFRPIPKIKKVPIQAETVLGEKDGLATQNHSTSALSGVFLANKTVVLGGVYHLAPYEKPVLFAHKITQTVGVFA